MKSTHGHEVGHELLHHLSYLSKATIHSTVDVSGEHHHTTPEELRVNPRNAFSSGMDD
ncbi:MAG TPA: hypothetical protein VN328_09290 [Thermodesulfovibrionales bacterium]|nr:hypothetical protein [Thermodesulfovibrionales bacterium]